MLRGLSARGPTTESTVLVDRFTRALANAGASKSPYQHWFLENVLPGHVAERVGELPIEPAALAYTEGRREAHNSARVLLGRESATLSARQERRRGVPVRAHDAA